MIVQSTRISRDTGFENLARHLLDKPEDNEVIELIAGSRSALSDAQTFADLRRCRYALRHLSISPASEMSPQQLSEFVGAIDKEFQIGSDRPRLIVRHLKKGRSHFHFVIGEVDPGTLRVLDCRKDYERLEALARNYERCHEEIVQLSRSERHAERIVGLSQQARRRAERNADSFDRTRLRDAFANGTTRLFAELTLQGLTVVAGRKCPIFVNRNGKFVAAAHRACVVRLDEARRAFSVAADPKSRVRHLKVSGSSRRPDFQAKTLTQRELWLLCHGKVDWEDLLKRAENLAEAMQGLFRADGSPRSSGSRRSHDNGNQTENSGGRKPK